MKWKLITLFVLFFNPSLLAQQDLPSIRGRVLPAEGEQKLPEQGMLTLRSARGSIVATETIHSSGRFEFYRIGPGSYELLLECPGHRPVRQQVVLGMGYDAELSAFVTIRVGPPLAQGDQPPAAVQATRSARYLEIPKKARQELEKAEQASSRGKHEEAVRHLKRALDIAPDLYHAYNNLAVEYLELGLTEDAIEVLTNSIRINPEVASTHRNLGVIYLDGGDTKQALQNFQRALQIDPRDAQALMLAGEAYYHQGQFQLALESFQQAAELEPTNLEAHLYQGHSLLQLRRTRDAIEKYEFFLERAGSDDRVSQIRTLLEQLGAR
jgi:tetratricopeptide (TPR) repeat protein